MNMNARKCQVNIAWLVDSKLDQQPHDPLIGFYQLKTSSCTLCSGSKLAIRPLQHGS